MKNKTFQPLILESENVENFQEYNFNLSSEEESELNNQIADQTTYIIENILGVEENKSFEFLCRFKAEAIRNVYDIMVKNHSNYTPEDFNLVENAYIERKIGDVKTREFTNVEDKILGFTEGKFVRKVVKSDDDEYKNKHKFKWLAKKSSPEKKNIAEEICEYVGTNLMNFYLKDNSPKIRILKKEGEAAHLLIKFLNNYTDFSNIDARRIDAENLEGKAEFYVANLVLVDVDNNSNNFGFRDLPNGDKAIARIDHGKIFSYRTVKKTSDEEQFEKVFAQENLELAETNRYNQDFDLKNLEKKIFSQGRKFFKNPQLFEGEDFFFDVQKITSNLPVHLGLINKIIDKSMDNIKQAYGEEVFHNNVVKTYLCERMNIPDENFSEEVFKQTIVDNIQSINEKIENKVLEKLSEYSKENKDQNSENGKRKNSRWQNEVRSQSTTLGNREYW